MVPPAPVPGPQRRLSDIAVAFIRRVPLEYWPQHPTLVEGSRASMTPCCCRFRLRAGSLPRGSGCARFPCPDARSPPAQAPNSWCRGVAWTAASSERDTTSFGAGSTQTLEPRVFYVYVRTATRTPYRSSIPRSPISTIRSSSRRTASSAATVRRRQQAAAALTSRIPKCQRRRSCARPSGSAITRCGRLALRRPRRCAPQQLGRSGFDRRAHRPALDVRRHHPVQHQRPARRAP